MTDPVTGFQTNLLTGLAVYLAAAASIGATYRASGKYEPTETGIVLGNIPQSPDRIIALTIYDSGHHPSLSTSSYRLQVRTRWGGQDKRYVDNLDDAIFDLLEASQHLVLTTGVHVTQIQHYSGPLPLGQDTNNRWGLSHNYELTVHRPSTNRT